MEHVSDRDHRHQMDTLSKLRKLSAITRGQYSSFDPLLGRRVHGLIRLTFGGLVASDLLLIS